MAAGVKKVLFAVRLFTLFIIAIPSLAYSGEIRVSHGNFDHFNIYMPATIIAGEDLAVRLQAVDNLNNSILSFGEPKKFTISIAGSATVTPASFDSSSFAEGSLMLIVNDKAAENGTLSVTESGNPIPILSKEFSVLPGKLDSLSVHSPNTVIAGESFDVKIIEKDSFGNIVPEPIYANNLNISFKGNTEPKADLLSMAGFKNGVGIVKFTAEKAGTVMIEIKDMESGRSGVSGKINVLNGPLHSFKLLQPKEVITGEPFDFSVIPVDRFGNVVLNYSSTGNGVAITSSGKLKPFPSTIPAYAFVNGQAKAALRYDGAETVKMTVTEIGNKQTSISDNIAFIPPSPDRFEIVTPDAAIAGQKFKVKIIAYNQLSHVFKNYNVIGTDVSLSTTGTGILMPNRVPPSEFVDGIAIVDLQYDKSEAFEITASAEKIKSNTVVNKTTEKGRPATAISKPAGKIKLALEGSKAAEKTKPTTKTSKVIEKVKPVPEISKSPITTEKIKMAPLVNTDTKQQKSEATKKGTKKVYEIQKISIDELANRATVSININNIDSDLVYKVDTKNRKGEKWVFLKIRSAADKIGGEPKIASSVISNVAVEKDKNDAGAVVVKMKLLTQPYYNVWVGGNSINVTILKP